MDVCDSHCPSCGQASSIVIIPLAPGVDLDPPDQV